MLIGFPDPLQISSRIESQQVLRPTMVYHELSALPSNGRLKGPQGDPVA